ncbi:hypothetical protein [Vibrio barjaei]|uniref:hypothetical protein n=1 Tax=Vibrio barjaei TaxID=1676683 RepID=UPI0022850A5A|nr:hypothetical protein [Vibrio barjaei]MCY9870454.1 hypothetical protein [Vibrio barjaei]
MLHRLRKFIQESYEAQLDGGVGPVRTLHSVVEYQSPEDYPGKLVFRLHAATATSEGVLVKPLELLIVLPLEETLVDRAYDVMSQRGMVRTERSPSDDPVISGTWLL